MNMEQQIKTAHQKHKEAEAAFIETFHEWNDLLVKQAKEAHEQKYSPVLEVS